MQNLKIPTMLLERLKTEFDNNYKMSIKSAGDNSTMK